MASNPYAQTFLYLDRFEYCLQLYFESLTPHAGSSKHLERLLDSMSYSSLGGGKRLRAMLVYQSAQCCSSLDNSNSGLVLDPTARPTLRDWSGVDAAAVAVELIHCYSLVHDDLPAMDDDDLRRGKPTCHKAFDEATAILAGDALQARAFAVLASLGQNLDAQQRLTLIQTLALASGDAGMVGGQAIDLALTNHPGSYEELVEMHSLKTGALISSAVAMGGIAANASADQVTALSLYGKAIGLAFQIRDDLLDEEGDTARIGKQAGMDSAANKTTFPALIGMDAAREEANKQKQLAFEALAVFGDSANGLRELANFMIERDR